MEMVSCGFDRFVTALLAARNADVGALIKNGSLISLENPRKDRENFGDSQNASEFGVALS